MQNLPKNTIIALIALALYTQCNHINLANNGTIMLIILALLCDRKRESEENEDHNGNQVIYPQNPIFPQTIYPQNQGCGCYPNASPYQAGYQTAVPYSAYHTGYVYNPNRCGCNMSTY